MGFGYLFYGFLMMIEVSVGTSAEYALGVDLFPDLAGYLLMLTAAYRLTPYAKGFGLFRKTLYPLVAVGAVSFAVDILSVFGVFPNVLISLSHGAKYAALLLQPVAFLFLFSGIMTLAASVELPSVVSRAKFTAVLGTVYYAAQLIFMLASDLPLPLTEGHLASLRFILMIVWLVYVILAEVVLFNCYMYICYEGEETVSAEDAVNPLAKFLNKFKKGKGDR